MSVRHCSCLLFSNVLCDADSPVCANRSLLENKIAVDRASLTIVDCYLDSNPPVTQVPHCPSSVLHCAVQVYWLSARQGHQSRLAAQHSTLMDGFSRLSYSPGRQVLLSSLHCTVPALGRPSTGSCSATGSTAWANNWSPAGSPWSRQVE